MKIIPLLLLGLIVLPETIVHIPILPFGIVDAHPIHAPVHVSAPEMNNMHQQTLECDACMYLANGLNQTILHNPKVLSIVTDDLQKICTVLPVSIQTLCTEAATQTAPLLINHLGDFIATEGCDDLGVCHSNPVSAIH